MGVGADQYMNLRSRSSVTPLPGLEIGWGRGRERGRILVLVVTHDRNLEYIHNSSGLSS